MFSKLNFRSIGNTFLVAFVLGLALVGFSWVMEEGPFTAKVIVGFGFFVSLSVHLLNNRE